MTKVYVLLEGDTSDCMVVGVFSQKESAERVNSLIVGSDGEIEEHDLDELEGYELGPVYRVYIRLDTGKVDLGKPTRSALRHPTAETVHRNAEEITVLSPISEEHAKTVAFDEYQRTTGRILGTPVRQGE